MAKLFLELLPRTFDIVLSLFLLIVLAPAILIRAVFAKVKTGKVFAPNVLIGRFRTPFRCLRFAGNDAGEKLAVLFNILKGNMAFAGPRPMSEEEASHLTSEQGIRFTLRPGLFSPHGLRRKIGIAYDSETISDTDFYYSETVQGDMGLVARSLIGDLFAGAAYVLHRPFSISLA